MTRRRRPTWASLRDRLAHVDWGPQALLWLAMFLLYAATTARGVLPADSGEFQLAAIKWGIPHPPGYPLYTMGGALWVRLFPFGPQPFRLNLLSALLAATTVTLIAHTVIVWSQAVGSERHWARWGGLIAGLALGLAGTFWAQATIANIRMPTMLFTAWGYLALARYRAALQESDPASNAAGQRALLELALILGLGVGHHPSLVFIAAGWAIYVLWLTPNLLWQPRRWVGPAVVAALAWVVPQLYLPIRGSMTDVALAPSDLNTWSGFWDHVLARGFGGDMFAYTGVVDLALRLPLLPTLLRLQFSPFMLALIVVGTVVLLWRRPRIAISLLVAWLMQTYVTITYRAPQTVEYLMPAYVPMVLSLGLFVALLPSAVMVRLRPRLSHVAVRTLTLLMLGTLMLRLPQHAPGFVELANDPSIRERLVPLLEMATPDTTILADWRWATPLWVLQAVENRAPDAEVAYVYPVDDVPYEEVWRVRTEAVAGDALLATHRFTWDDWAFAPVGGGYRLYRRPLTEMPSELAYAPLDAAPGPIRVLGYRWRGQALPGESLELQIAWQAIELQEPAPSFTARLWTDQEQLLTVSDLGLGTDITVGEVRFAELTLQLPFDRCSPTIYPTLGVYTVVGKDFEDHGTLSLPALPVPCNYPRLPSERAWPGVVLGGGPFLRGIDYDTHGDLPATAYLHWCGPGDALTVSVGNAEAHIDALSLGECQTVQLLVPPAERLQLTLSRTDGATARLLALPLPQPRAGERYLPFGNEMVLVGSELTPLSASSSSAAVLTLKWRTVGPLSDDYAVSARLHDIDMSWLGMHDMQPGVGAIPTLKWVTRNTLFRDPHVFETPAVVPTFFSLTVYERFRMTPLKSAYGDIATYTLPPNSIHATID